MRSAFRDETEGRGHPKAHFRAQDRALADLEDYRVLKTTNFDLNVADSK